MARLLISQAAKLILIGGLATFLLSIYTLHPASSKLRESVSSIFTSSKSSQCSPELWSSGQWTRRSPPRTNKDKVESLADVLLMEGTAGCASDRTVSWHLGAEEDQWHRFPEVAAFDWTPPSSCHARPFDRIDVIRDMVEQGGWLVLGDSITEGHFFSLSCMLFPDVIATPNHTLNPYYDRAWPQNLYLHPQSPLIPLLNLPKGFDISITPLVTFRRVDLLLTQEQLIEVHREHHPEQAVQPGFDLFGGDAAWEVAPSEYLALFTAPLPEANYGTMITSTAGHWTVGTFTGLRDDSMQYNGIQNVMDFMGEAMHVWADMVQDFLGAGSYTAGGRRRRVVIRSYIPGHDGCHDILSPWTWYEQGNRELSYNWAQIPPMNDIFQDVVKKGHYEDIHFLSIDRPALLRPDAHVGSDCLHWMHGAGVIEGWSEYIWHYITREIPSTPTLKTY